MNLDQKKFITTNNKNWLSSNETVFHYFQNNNTNTGHYKGSANVEGFIVGKQTDVGKIELLYQCLTTKGELKVGESKGIISKGQNGKLHLAFDWNWLNGDRSGGTSIYTEIT